MPRGSSAVGRFLWLCPPLSIALAVGILLVAGVSPWTAILAALVLGCPIAALWAYLGGRSPRGGGV